MTAITRRALSVGFAGREMLKDQQFIPSADQCAVQTVIITAVTNP